jgi:hypothetical protein
LQTCPNNVDKALTDLLEVLNVRSAEAAKPRTDRRTESRCTSCTRCELRIFSEQGHEKKVADVITRNRSFCGLSVLAQLSGPVTAGRPVEVVAGADDVCPTHVAGTVAFCRDIGPRHCEIGIHVKAVGPTWILAEDVEAAKAQYDWFAKALQVPVK